MSGRINHVSIHARDLQESEDFYAELLGAEPIPTPNFGFPVRWLAFGRTQLHLFLLDVEAPSRHHFGLTVDDVEPIYRAAERMGAIEPRASGNHFVELPDDVVQLYIRDPAGNLVEIDYHGASKLPGDLRERIQPLAESFPQTEENLTARLFLTE